MINNRINNRIDANTTGALIGPRIPLARLLCASLLWARLLCAGLLCAGLQCTSGATLEVDVVDSAGKAVSDAVITATPVSGNPGKPPGTAIIDQIHRRYVPLVSVIQTGTSVTFPNKDNIEHDVYSFSPAKTFELNLYSGVAAHPIVFDKPGLVVLGCNIHDQMIAYVQVVDTPYFAKTDVKGHAQIDGLPPESYVIDAWHYLLADPKSKVTQTVKVEANTSVHFTLAVTVP